jgi:hypothetical protein
VQLEPDEVSLDADQVDRIRRILKRASIASPNSGQILARDVADTMSVYRAENSQSDVATTFREKRDSFRELWRLAEQPDPPVGQIRARLKELPTEILRDIEERAERRWPHYYFDEPAPTTSAERWLANAPAEKLVAILPPSISYGGQWILGRGRGSGRRSKPQYEPMILSVVRGSRPSSKSATVDRSECDRVADGRPGDDATPQLISFLAMDWVKATEQIPIPGRSDKTPFGDLVHQVFGWLGLPDATGALRRYWRMGANGEPKEHSPVRLRAQVR